MNHRQWKTLIGQLLACGGPTRLHARIGWPLHAALASLERDAASLGLLHLFPGKMLFEPSAEVGLRAIGADDALLDLVDDGVLRPTGILANAALLSDETRLADYRRTLLRLDPRLGAIYRRAGSRWAACAFTVEKNVAAPEWSPTPSVSGGRARRHLELLAVR